MDHPDAHKPKNTPRRRHVIWAFVAAAVVAAYFATPAILLRWDLDGLVFGSPSSDPTHENQAYRFTVAPETTITVRRYGTTARSCVFFFPGQHGGMGTYERTLFPLIRQTGADIFAISYPGQDGATGKTHLDRLPDQVASAILQVSNETFCKASQSVFIGRSLGASIALWEASKFNPKGVLIDGLGTDLTSVIHAWITRHPILMGWQLLPIQELVGDRGHPAQALLDTVSSIPITVFQGKADAVTPFALAQNATRGRSNVRFTAVDKGTHENTYRLASRAYLESLRSMQSADASERE